MNDIENFSEGYYIVHADLIEWPDEGVGVPRDLMKAMLKRTPAPMLKIGTEHYMAEPENAMPADTIAIPPHADGEEDHALLAKADTIMEFKLEEADFSGDA